VATQLGPGNALSKAYAFTIAAIEAAYRLLRPPKILPSAPINVAYAVQAGQTQ